MGGLWPPGGDRKRAMKNWSLLGELEKGWQ